MDTTTLPRVLLLILTLWSVLCQGAVILYQVEENNANDVVLGDLGVYLRNSNLATPEQIANMRYNFLNVGDNYVSLFSLSEDTGSISALANIDRESLCDSRAMCILQLRVGATSGSYFQTININVTILDANDNKPVFSRSTVSIPISERTPEDSTFPILSATDADAAGSNNSKIIYELIPNSGTFGLFLEVNQQGKTDVSIVLKQTVDREKLASYEIYVVAKDLGKPQLSSTLTVNVTVLDYNDNKPVFSEPSGYSKTVNEDVPVGIITTVTATDADAGSNGEVRYSFSDSTSSNSRSFFEINELTGDISTVKALAYPDRGEPFRLFVKARDNGVPQLTSEVLVEIFVNDINNHSPEININVLSSSQTARVKENSNIGTIVAYVAVVDKDSSVNGQVTCSLSNSLFGLVDIQNSDNEFNVVTRVQLDREKVIEHVVTIQCQDGGTPIKESSASFIVQVQDVNDNRPTFSPSDTYYANISENSDIGVFVVRVMASDDDQGVNANVRYYVEPSFAEQFYVEPSRGFVKTNVRFDREEIEQISFRVLAVDGGDSPFTSTATVVLTILDVNDEYPIFTRTIFEFNITENSRAEVQVGNLTATDKDTGNNAKIIFSLLPQYQVNLPFMVHPNGTISVNRALDREDTALYKFRVKAKDQGTPVKNSTAEVIIKVLDENDNYPQIRNPIQNNGTVFVSHLTPQGSEVTRVDAYDLDEGQNGALVYSIVRGDQDLFFIEESTGKVYLGRTINTNDIREYNLFIIVSDKGRVPKQSGADIKLKVEYSHVSKKVEGAIGQNVLIAISIACVTIVLSLAIIVTIFLIRRMDHKKYREAGSLTHNEEQKASDANNQKQYSKNTNVEHDNGAFSHVLASDLSSHDRHNNNMNVKKEVNFSMDEHRDSGIFMIGNDHSSPVPMSRALQLQNNTSPHKYSSKSLAESPVASYELQNYVELDDSTSDSPQPELHRAASIRLQQKLNTYNKQPQYITDENKQFLYLNKKNLEDSRSDGSGDVTITDSGRGGSDEDMHHHMHPSIMI